MRFQGFSFFLGRLQKVANFGRARPGTQNNLFWKQRLVFTEASNRIWIYLFQCDSFPAQRVFNFFGFSRPLQKVASFGRARPGLQNNLFWNQRFVFTEASDRIWTYLFRLTQFYCLTLQNPFNLTSYLHCQKWKKITILTRGVLTAIASWAFPC